MGSSESWVFLPDDKIIYHVENDGWTFMRRGAEAQEYEVTLDELKDGNGYSSSRYEEALKSIIEKVDHPLRKEAIERLSECLQKDVRIHLRIHPEDALALAAEIKIVTDKLKRARWEKRPPLSERLKEALK